jgi:hypothetical protein
VRSVLLGGNSSLDDAAIADLLRHLPTGAAMRTPLSPDV